MKSYKKKKRAIGRYMDGHENRCHVYLLLLKAPLSFFSFYLYFITQISKVEYSFWLWISNPLKF